MIPDPPGEGAAAAGAGPAGPPADGYRDRFLPIASWALYDFANTLFSAMVVTLAMPRVLGEITGLDQPMAWASAAALMLSALFGPFLGALADATGSFKRQVILWTTVCCGGSVTLSLLPLGNAAPIFTVFVLSFVAYNVAISLYDSFLPDLCSPSRIGLVSGIGVGVGYLGALLGYPLAMWVKDRWPYESIFAAAGILMFVFSIPMFLFVRERAVASRRPFSVRLGAEEFLQAMRTIRRLPARPALFLFLAGNFLAVDSLNSMIQWVAQFFRKAWGAEEDVVIGMLTGLSLSAFVLGMAAGRVADAIGGRKVLLASVASLLVVSLADSLLENRTAALTITVLGGGLGAAGVWLSGRTVLVELAPPDRLGEHMGLLGLTRKASVLGTLMLATVADHYNWRLAVGLLSVPLALGGGLLLLSGGAARREAAGGRNGVHGGPVTGR